MKIKRLALLVTLLIPVPLIGESFPLDDEVMGLSRSVRQPFDSDDARQLEERYRFDKGTGRENRRLDSRPNPKWNKDFAQRQILFAEVDRDISLRSHKPRAVASLAEPTPRSELRIQPEREIVERQDIEARLALLGGIGSLSSTNANVDSTRVEQGLSQNSHVGFYANVDAWRYLGFELDGFYGLAPKRDITTQTASGTVSSNRSLRHMGVMGNIKLQLPLPAGITIIPKIGAGYGLLSFQHTQSTADSSTVTTQKVGGAYLTAGVDFFPVSGLHMYADYSLAPGASGTVTVSNTSTDNESRELGKTQLNRFRLGAQVQVTGNFWVGAQYAFRSVNDTYLPSEASSEETEIPGEQLNQFMAALALTF